MSSDAVGLERVSTVVGYKITKGNFNTATPNLPQRVAIFAEANEDNQAVLALPNGLDGKQISSAKQAGDLWGYGSPIYHIARILFPVSGGGIGGIPVIVYPQAKAIGAAAKVFKIVPSGVANANGTHTIVIAGRYGQEGKNYDINIEKGDTTDVITDKISDAVNGVLGCPFKATSTDYEAALTSKWKGLTADALNVSVDVNSKSLGLTYTVTAYAAASGTPSVQSALEQFGNQWVTLAINSYGTVPSVMDAFEAFNGIPDPDAPTGRFNGIVIKPLIALTGSVDEDPSAITDSRSDQVTIAICPAPLSEGLPMEAAANMAVLQGKVAQDTPHLDVQGQSYPDMPTPNYIGVMGNYDDRDRIVKLGCSTVDLVNGRYQVQDFVSTYHLAGEFPPQFRYVRNLNIDFNIAFGHYLLVQTNVIGHAIAADDDIVSAVKVIKPKQFKQLLNKYAEDLGNRALIADVPFMQDSVVVNIGSSNPDRMEDTFKYKRSGYARIVATTGEAGFNFGS